MRFLYVFQFCTEIFLDNTVHEVWLLLAVGIAGITSGCLVAVFASHGENPTARMLRTSMGFFVAMVWIMAIADEVVGVLQVCLLGLGSITLCSILSQTFGFIFGLSDAIIGLTIFAVGNSLADFVANMSVAVSLACSRVFCVLSNYRSLLRLWDSLPVSADPCSTCFSASGYLAHT